MKNDLELGLVDVQHLCTILHHGEVASVFLHAPFGDTTGTPKSKAAKATRASLLRLREIGFVQGEDNQPHKLSADGELAYARWLVKTYAGPGGSRSHQDLAWAKKITNVYGSRLRTSIPLDRTEIATPEHRFLHDGEAIAEGDEAFTWSDPDCRGMGWIKCGHNSHGDIVGPNVVPIRRLRR